MSKIIDSTDESETIVSDGEKELEIEEIFKKVETENGGSSVYKKLMWIRDLPMNEGCFESPIDINLKNAKEMDLPPLIWMNFETPPKKTKITNTGHTIIFSAKWKEERPYIANGPLIGKYVFSNFHFHWGADAMEGSEHSVDGYKYPAELHVLFFRSSYLTQEAALKEQDGCAALVYLFNLQDEINPTFQIIIQSLEHIADANCSKKIENIVLTKLIKPFQDDYFFYWGSVSTEDCIHYIMWLIAREPIGISIEQLNALRYIFDENGDPLLRNYREVQDLHNRTILHISPSTSRYATLLPLPGYEHPPVQEC
ncbi:carbonic anhydrase 2-like [Diabrotica virgifera virgifera]|uniref:Carbonic anhydrase n=2 Tax=Diabrotica virgifera virgifera TaxID=50390 RepID=A0ABM5L040_DIAVI|nr:carbonic anhydrase 2-like [Diabrotica virgifera virgifera]